MGILGSAKRLTVRGMKRLGALTRITFRRYAVRIFALPRSSFDYAGEVGDGTGSSTVMAPLLWIARTFPEAPPALWQVADDGREERIRAHPVLRLLQRPNGFYTGPILWMATLTDWNVDGNAYWLKLRTRTGQVGELWWVPHWMMEPKADPDRPEVFVDHYEYRPGMVEPVWIRPEDVVHFRFGLDPDDQRKGYSPLKSILREVFTDDEAANFTASLLRNMGVPGVIVSPDTDEPPTADDVKLTKAYVEEMFTGERRGAPLVLSGKTKVEQFGFSPEQLLLRELRRIPEERVCAVLGVPAIVAGMGAGLERSTFTNMGEAREMAYESNIIPTQRILAEDIRFQLLSDFQDDVWSHRFGFDLDRVRVLQDDVMKQAQRHALAVREGVEMRSEFRRALGLPVKDARDDVFLVPANTVTIPADGSEPVRANGNGNGNGPQPNAQDLVAEVLRELERRQSITG